MENNDSQVDLSQVLITEEIREKMGLDHNLVGKPLTEGLEQAKKARGMATEASQKAKEFEKQALALAADKAKLEKEMAEKSEELPTPPDAAAPGMTAEQYQAEAAKWQQQIMDAVKKTVKQEVSPLQQAQQANQLNSAIGMVQSSLPEGVDAVSEINEWGKQNNLTGEEIRAMLVNPKLQAITMGSIIQHANSKQNLEQQRLDGLQGLKNNVNAVTQNKQVSSINSVNRSSAQPDSQASRILKNLEKQANAEQVKRI